LLRQRRADLRSRGGMPKKCDTFNFVPKLHAFENGLAETSFQDYVGQRSVVYRQRPISVLFRRRVTGIFLSAS
jgi:hypothetical protein